MKHVCLAAVTSLTSTLKPFFFIALTLFIFGCQNDPAEPEKTPVQIFSLTVDASFDLSKDYWVMLHDTNGKALDAKQIKSAGDFDFQTTETVSGDQIGVTLFHHDSTATDHFYIFNSYLAIPVGQHWVLKKKNSTTTYSNNFGAKTGTFTVRYELPPSGVVMETFGGSGSLGSYSVFGNIKRSSLDIYEKSNDFLLTIADEDGNVKYKYFEDVVDKQSVTLNYSDLDLFDHVVDISFPPATDPYVSVSADAGNQQNYFYTYYNGFNLPPYAPSASRTSLKIGYLDRFKKYNTYIQLNFKDFGFTYSNTASIPASFEVPDQCPYRVTNKTWDGFSYQADKPFNMRSTRFGIPSNSAYVAMSWNFLAPDGVYKVLELPEAFEKKYPQLAIHNFEYATSSFIVSNESYTDVIKSAFMGAALPEEREDFSFNIW
ncbi:hypothetical protein SAMN04488109_0473 [Chryseolinea serpens]|uniref:Uncharacterized protein n=1 Tax=Chryseolinea serpens TaxID=947013 RepID=A0A1M5K6I1_9BACT|nr:hypothetical protein [Chryseolinea serpens]SHG48447.1 hypothetical protein SAMN04488109_0473 [Chryseolinea serpens]